MSNARKTITFNKSKPEQNKAFIFLEKIRYHQTEFVTKLITDYINEHNLDINGSYDEIRDCCYKYISDELPQKTIETDFVTKDSLMEKLVRIESQLQQIINNNFNGTNNDDSPMGQIDPSAIKTDKEKDAPVQDTNTAVEKDPSLDSMLSSFKFMAGE